MGVLCQKSVVFLIAVFISFDAPLGVAASPSWQPSATVELIASASPGSVHDRLARVTMRIMQDGKLVPSALSVTNKSGGGSTVALAYLDQNHANPHYLATAAGTVLTTHITGATRYNYTDFTLLSVLFSDYNVFSVRADSPIKSGTDLLAKLKSDPKSVSFAFASASGNYNHIAIARVAKAAGADIREVRTVVFDGGGKAATALLGGHVDVLVGGPGNIVAHVQAGKLRAIALSAPQRYEAGELADVSTWKEQGVDMVSGNPYYFLGPKGMEQGQIEFWEQVFSRVVKTPDWKEFAQKNFWVTLHANRAEGAKYLRAYYDNYRETLRELGLAK